MPAWALTALGMTLGLAIIAWRCWRGSRCLSEMDGPAWDTQVDPLTRASGLSHPAWFLTAMLAVLATWYVHELYQWKPALWLTGVFAVGIVVADYVWGVRPARAFRRSIVSREYRVCPGCLYDLSGSPAAGRCPECGQSYSRSALKRRWEQIFNIGH